MATKNVLWQCHEFLTVLSSPDSKGFLVSHYYRANSVMKISVWK